jgi:hypothetical protein
VSFIIFISPTTIYCPSQKVINSAGVPQHPPDARRYLCFMLIDGTSPDLCECFEEAIDGNRLTLGTQRRASSQKAFRQKLNFSTTMTGRQ